MSLYKRRNSRYWWATIVYWAGAAYAALVAPRTGRKRCFNLPCGRFRLRELLAGSECIRLRARFIGDEDKQIRVPHIDASLRKQSRSLAPVVGLVVEKMHDQAEKVPVRGHTLHVCVV